MLVQLLIAFNLGLFSTLHCLGMCGGILSAMMFLNKGENNSGKLTYSIAYNIGRISSYSLAGLIVAFVSQEITTSFFSANSHFILQTITAIFLVGIALNMLGILPFNSYIEKMGSQVWKNLQPLGKHLIPVKSIPHALMFGMIWGWLPCGMVYAALILAMSTTDSLGGFLVMLSFGLGTLPGMVSAGYFSSTLIELKSNNRLRVITALMLILIAASLPISAYYFSGHHSQHDHNSHEDHHSHHHLH